MSPQKNVLKAKEHDGDLGEQEVLSHKCVGWGWSCVCTKETATALVGLRGLVERWLPLDEESEEQGLFITRVDLSPFSLVSLPQGFSALALLVF